MRTVDRAGRPPRADVTNKRRPTGGQRCIRAPLWALRTMKLAPKSSPERDVCRLWPRGGGTTFLSQKTLDTRKTLDTHRQSIFCVFSGSWSPPLRTSEVPSPVCNVFPAGVIGGRSSLGACQSVAPLVMFGPRAGPRLTRPTRPLMSGPAAGGPDMSAALDDSRACIRHLSSRYPPEASSPQWLQPVAISRLQP